MKFRKVVKFPEGTFYIKGKNHWNSLKDSLNNYTPLTLEGLKAAIAEMFYEKGQGLTYQELRSKILSGYNYKVFSDKTSLFTGRGGVLMYLDSFEKTGFPAPLAAGSIFVYIDGKYHNILTLNIKKND